MNRLLSILTITAAVGIRVSLCAEPEKINADGLVLWLKPEVLIGCNRSSVDCWADSSPAKNNAVEFDSASLPVLRENQIHGYPAVMFEADGQRLRLPSLNLPYETTVFIVSFDYPQEKTGSVHHAILAADNSPYRKNGDGYGIGYAKETYDGAIVILSDGKNWQHLRDLYTQYSRTAWEVLTFCKKGDHVEFLRDGNCRDSRSFDRPADALYHTGYLLGGDVNGRDYRGGIAEVIVYDHGLEPDEVRRVHAYLSEKYDIPVADQPRLTSHDPRFFNNGTLMLKRAYADQPYVIQLTDNEWMAVVTHSNVREGSRDQHMSILRSSDAGKTWAKISVLEPSNEMRQPSWGTLLKTSTGRICCFYNLNRLPSEGKGVHFVYRFSDDKGLSWSERFILPIRETWHNRQFNSFSSWSIDQPLVADGTVYIAFSKFGPNASGWQGEGFVFRSKNVFTETDPDKIVWEMLPEGDHGIVSSRVGTLQEEHNIESLGDDDLYCAFRTLEGYVGETYSRDGGETWSEPDFAHYANGRKIKNPRACPMVWRCKNDNYLLWFHNNDGRQAEARNKDRNPAWLSGGILKDGRIVWSQPEPVLFTFAPAFNSGLSYPDLVEHDGKYYISATDKQQARLCEIDKEVLENLWKQDQLNAIPQDNLITNTAAVFLPDLTDNGFTVTCSGGLKGDKAGLIWSALDHDGNGVALRRTVDGKISAEFKDRHMREVLTWNTDSSVSENSTVSFIFDGAANWIYVVVNGVLCDGGEARQFGWGPIPYQMARLTEVPVCIMCNAEQGLLHNRALSVLETIGIHRNKKGCL